MIAKESHIDVTEWTENGVTVKRRVADGHPTIEVTCSFIVSQTADRVVGPFELSVGKADALRLGLSKALHGYT